MTLELKEDVYYQVNPDEWGKLWDLLTGMGYEWIYVDGTASKHYFINDARTMDQNAIVVRGKTFYKSRHSDSLTEPFPFPQEKIKPGYYRVPKGRWGEVWDLLTQDGYKWGSPPSKERFLVDYDSFDMVVVREEYFWKACSRNHPDCDSNFPFPSSEKEMNIFCVEVNSTTSRVLQEFAFKQGYKWETLGKTVNYTNQTILMFTDRKYIYYRYNSQLSNSGKKVSLEEAFTLLERKPVKVKINNEWVAEVCPEKIVKIGCQSFTFAEMKKIISELTKAMGEME